MVDVFTKPKISAAQFVLVFSVLVLAIVVGIPVILIFLTAFFEDGKLNIPGFVHILKDPDTYQALWNSLITKSRTLPGRIISKSSDGR